MQETVYRQYFNIRDVDKLQCNFVFTLLKYLPMIFLKYAVK